MLKAVVLLGLLLTGGQSIEVHVDATTGQLLGEDELR